MGASDLIYYNNQNTGRIYVEFSFFDFINTLIWELFNLCSIQIQTIRQLQHKPLLYLFVQFIDYR